MLTAYKLVSFDAEYSWYTVKPHDHPGAEGTQIVKISASSRALVQTLVLLVVSSRGFAQEAIAQGAWYASVVDDDRRIMAEIQNHSEQAANLEYLSDVIGARLTGSTQLVRASEWTRDMFAKYDVSNARLEPWTISNGWTRGSAHGRITRPIDHPLTLASAAWAPGTNGAVSGPVVQVSAETPEQLARFKGKLKGAIVITGDPPKLAPAFEVPKSRILTPPGPPTPEGVTVDSLAKTEDAFSRFRFQFFVTEGVAAIVEVSRKPYGLLSTDETGGEPYSVRSVPSVFLAYEDYSLIWRLLKRGAVEIELALKNSYVAGPLDVFNTVAEIRGTEKPEEIVILAAHLDSWDLGTGAADNGSGSMAILEAARALRKLNLQPKRTIRFVLFSGEEQGLSEGSRAYVREHKDELERVSAVLVLDSGAGKIVSIGLQGNYQARRSMDEIVAPLQDIGLLELSMRSIFVTDHASFSDVGVPAFFCIQEPGDYSRVHHSQADTFDKIAGDSMMQNAQVLAVWAYNVAQFPELLPRKKSQASK